MSEEEWSSKGVAPAKELDSCRRRFSGLEKEERTNGESKENQGSSME
jgi:hypothetical protein